MVVHVLPRGRRTVACRMSMSLQLIERPVKVNGCTIMEVNQLPAEPNSSFSCGLTLVMSLSVDVAFVLLVLVTPEPNSCLSRCPLAMSAIYSIWDLMRRRLPTYSEMLSIDPPSGTILLCASRTGYQESSTRSSGTIHPIWQRLRLPSLPPNIEIGLN